MVVWWRRLVKGFQWSSLVCHERVLGGGLLVVSGGNGERFHSKFCIFPSLNSYSLFFSSINASFDNMTCMRNSLPNLKELFILESSQEVEYDEEESFREINRELEQFEHKPKPNLSETETINLGSSEDVKEIKISLHINQEIREAIIQLLFEYKDVFAWSYDDMPGLSVDLVVHKLPVYPDFPPV